MVKPNNAQLRELIELREFVIEVMTSMGVWSEELLTKLTSIDLGVLRKNATQRHGVTSGAKELEILQYLKKSK